MTTTIQYQEIAELDNETRYLDIRGYSIKVNELPFGLVYVDAKACTLVWEGQLNQHDLEQEVFTAFLNIYTEFSSHASQVNIEYPNLGQYLPNLINELGGEITSSFILNSNELVQYNFTQTDQYHKYKAIVTEPESILFARYDIHFPSDRNVYAWNHIALSINNSPLIEGNNFELAIRFSNPQYWSIELLRWVINHHIALSALVEQIDLTKISKALSKVTKSNINFTKPRKPKPGIQLPLKTRLIKMSPSTPRGKDSTELPWARRGPTSSDIFSERRKKYTKLTGKVINIDADLARIDNYQGFDFTELVPASSLSIFYRERGRHAEVINYFRQGLENALRIGDNIGSLKLLNNLGVAYWEIKDHDLAIEYFERSLQIARRINDAMSIARGLSNLGNVYKEKGKYSIAKRYLESSLELTEFISDPMGIVRNTCDLGLVYSMEKSFDIAEEYLKRSLSLAQRIGDPLGEIRSLGNLSIVHHQQKHTKIAINYLERGLDLARHVENHAMRAIVARSLGNLYEESGDLEAALRSVREATQIAEILKLPQQEEYRMKLKQLQE